MVKLLFMLVIFFFVNATNVIAEQRLYGIYSNLNSSSGEPSGYEMFILHDGRPGQCSDSVLFQVAEGWPQYPELLDCCACSVDRIEFRSKKFGKFIGKIENDTLVGEFVEMKQKVRLKKGLSFWQSQ
jgi:hypothetical protein